MSHPSPSHDKGNEYPEDKTTHYKKKTAPEYRKKHGTIMEHFGKIKAKSDALKKMMK
jgi:hypothetical protein